MSLKLQWIYFRKIFGIGPRCEFDNDLQKLGLTWTTSDFHMDESQPEEGEMKDFYATCEITEEFYSGNPL